MNKEMDVFSRSVKPIKAQTTKITSIVTSVLMKELKLTSGLTKKYIKSSFPKITLRILQLLAWNVGLRIGRM